VQHL